MRETADRGAAPVLSKMPGWCVPEGIGGNGDARGPCAGSGAAEQHDGVCLTTVRRAEAWKGRSQPSSERVAPFRPLTDGMPSPPGKYDKRCPVGAGHDYWV